MRAARPRVHGGIGGGNGAGEEGGAVAELLGLVGDCVAVEATVLRGSVAWRRCLAALP